MKHEEVSVNAVADWYNNRYRSGQEQSFGRPPEESIQRLEKVTAARGGRLLDVACGQGFFLKSAQAAGYATYGVDISAEAAQIAQRMSAESRVQVASGEHLPYADGCFDVLTCWGSLEHHPNMRQALAEFSRVTTAGAVIFLRVPNKDFWVYSLMEKFGRTAGTEQQDIIEHLHTLEEWRALFTEAGLEIRQVTADNWFLHQSFSAKNGFMANARLALRKLSLAVAPLERTYTFDFLCYKA